MGRPWLNEEFEALDPGALDELMEAAEVIEAAEARLLDAIDRTRRAGWAWETIAEICDYSDPRTMHRLVGRLRQRRRALDRANHPL